MSYDIQIIAAPSNLGLRPNGVELLAASLLDTGLAEAIDVQHPVVHVPTLNKLYSPLRDEATLCLNPAALRDFSIELGKTISDTVRQKRLALVLGGDCSVLLGIMPALKASGNYGLVFIDAHADFYEPERSTTGEVADMDLAIITGRGPEMLTNINGMQPYVKDAHVVHVAQRDGEETKDHGSQEIRDTAVTCFDMEYIQNHGIESTTANVVTHMRSLPVDGFWIHFDTDVLDDDINPAVEYHLPGGLQFKQAEYLVNHLLGSHNIIGISVTIFNPKMDADGAIAKQISACIANMIKPGDPSADA